MNDYSPSLLRALADNAALPATPIEFTADKLAAWEPSAALDHLRTLLRPGISAERLQVIQTLRAYFTDRLNHRN